MREDRLRQIPFLRDIPADTLDAISARLVPLSVGAHDTVFRAGDPGDAMYLVVSGQLDVIAPNNDATLASLGPGSFVGEMALLSGEPRSASLVAASDAELLGLQRDDFDKLLREHTILAVRLSEELSRRLAATNQRVSAPPVTRFAAVWGDGVGALASALLAAGAGRVGVAVLEDAPAPPSLPDGVVDVIEMYGGVLEAETVNRWAGSRVDDLDRVLIVIPRLPSPAARAAVDVAEQLIAFGRPPGWVANGASRRRVVRCDGSDPSLARAVRWLTGRAVGLALSSGGSKSAAHIGVLRVLDELGITVDAVAGTSGGAIAGAALAYGLTPDDMTARIRDLALHTTLRRFDYNIVPRSALFKGERLRNLFDGWFAGVTFDDLQIPLWVVAADVTTGEEVVIDRGFVADGVRASMSIPMAFNPWSHDDRLLIDGAVVNPLPASVLRDAGLSFVIGSSVAGQETVVDTRKGKAPHLLQIMARMMNSMERELIKAQIPLVDVLIRPRVVAESSFDFTRVEQFVAEGERAAYAELEGLEKAIALSRST